MDDDLRDLLAAWLGDEGPGVERRAALLDRLRRDQAFRAAFLDEVRLLGMLKVVQSSEPRWLRLEDELGWSGHARTDPVSLEERVLRAAGVRPRRRRPGLWVLGAAAAALVALAVLPRLMRTDELPGPPAPALELGTVVRLEGVRWAAGKGPAEGDAVTAGRLRLLEGRLSLAFYNGVALAVEGPADLDLMAADRVFCRFGKLRTRVPTGAEGFTVFTEGFEVVDLGTEFALNQERNGTARLMVFEGQAAVSLLGEGDRTLRSVLLDPFRPVLIDPRADSIRDAAARPDAFTAAPSQWPTTLRLAPGYAAEVARARPWGYWRFESLDRGRVANEVPERPALRALGDVRLEGTPGRNHWAIFRANEPRQAFVMDGEWSPPRDGGYALELWVRADEPGLRALVSLIAARAEGPDENHVALVKLTARGGKPAHEPCVVRFLDRWPPDVKGGVNVFTRRTYVPDRWHHLVAQRTSTNLDLYVDGTLVAAAPALSDTATTACRLLVGRLKESPRPHPNEIRAFAGRVDELAVYERPLTAGEIWRHSRFQAPDAPKAP